MDTSLATAVVRIWDLPEGSIRKEDSNPSVYLIQNGQKRWVTSPEALFALGKTWSDVRVVPDGALNAIPDGPNISALIVRVIPYPVPLNRPVTVTITATDPVTGSAVFGQVLINGRFVANTDTPFTYTFFRFPFWYPDISGVVNAPDYLDSLIDFGFPF